MDARLSFVTLIVKDLSATREFYVDGLVWLPVFEADDVLMFKVADKVVLSMWELASASEELGAAPDVGGSPPITLAHNVASRDEVDRVLAQARDLGASVSAPQERAWGGYSGYFSDPDGFNWEICWNPGELGKMVLP